MRRNEGKWVLVKSGKVGEETEGVAVNKSSPLFAGASRPAASEALTAGHVSRLGALCSCRYVDLVSCCAAARF